MDERLMQIEQKIVSGNRFRNLLGIKVEDIESGWALLSLTVTDQLLQASNIMHGGVFAVLIDSAIGSAV